MIINFVIEMLNLELVLLFCLYKEEFLILFEFWYWIVMEKIIYVFFKNMNVRVYRNIGISINFIYLVFLM